MIRQSSRPRADWAKTIESQGMHYHKIDGVEFWDESACYSFTSREIDELEKATYELDKMCIAAVDYIIKNNRFARFEIPEPFIDMVKIAWDKDELTIYGRFDLAYDGKGPPKLLEYNADTPTALLEAAVIQWNWMKDVVPNADQFNSIHERLIEAWKRDKSLSRRTMYFSSLSEHLEDYMTVNYLRDTAIQAGLNTEFIPVEQIGWHQGRSCFTDLQENEIDQIFKLYPWEWLVREQFGPHLMESPTRWLESPWKMLLSNKSLLPVLWEMYPQSPYLLEASWEPLSGDFVRKPVLAREGANITIVENNQTVLETDGEYEAPFVYQRLHSLPSFEGNYPVVGSWMVNGWACGIGIREDTSRVTRNTSRFVPHIISS